MNDEIVITIRSPRFTAGIVVRKGRVIDAAPILRKLIGMNGRQVAYQCRINGWTWIHPSHDDRRGLPQESVVRPARR